MIEIKEELLEKAIKKDVNKLKGVLKASYSLKPLNEIEVLEIAIDTNKRLGYELFDDLYYPRLVTDFSLVSRTVAKDAIKKQ